MHEFDMKNKDLTQVAAETEKELNESLNQKASELGLACSATFKMSAKLRANAEPTFAPSYVVYLSKPNAKRLYKERMLGKRGAEASYMLVGDGSVSLAELRCFSQYLAY